MKRPDRLKGSFGVMIVLACLLTGCSHSSGQSSNRNEETIVMIRHGEKPAAGLGQLDCKGLNRALALPSLLIGRFGNPDFIYAPNPSVQVSDHSASGYSYVRPLATIEPTAIRLGMPVNAQIGYDRIDLLQQALLQPAYAHSLVFVAWEHAKLHDFAEQMVKSYGTGHDRVPDWPGSDYETIYVFHITRTEQNGAPQARLEIQQEGLTNSLSDACPGPK